jgi:hypothetical protein
MASQQDIGPLHRDAHGLHPVDGELTIVIVDDGSEDRRVQTVCLQPAMPRRGAKPWARL